ncbi:MAG: endonuclease III [Clostridium sp. 27_14]|nr:MAG: endonuclease III [Clostridium sp. 27_14]
MTKQNAKKIIDILCQTYPDATCSLDFTTPFEMVVAVMLSAQCTDERVNKTTPELFKQCKTIEDYANIDIKKLEKIIHPCGFYKNKAKNIKLCAQQILDKYNGIVPNNMNDLLTLAGVGRKSANVILLEVYGIANGIAVDTHAKRISNLTGLSKEKDPEKIEKDLLKLLPKDYLGSVNHLFVWHGRNTCIARKPKCESCTIKNYCKSYNKTKHS